MSLAVLASPASDVAAENTSASSLDTCRTQIRGAFIKGIQPGETLLVHGTNIHSLQWALNNEGRLPTGRGLGIEKRLYFFPNTAHPHASSLLPQRHRFEGRDTQKLSVDEAIEGVTWYATRGAQEAMFEELYLKKFKKRPRYSLVNALVDGLANYNRFDNLETEGLQSRANLKDFNLWIPQIRGRYGIVLGLSPQLLEEFPLKVAEGQDDGLYIDAPKGLPLKFITGIEPLGDIEYKFFEDFGR